jgi:hypothetical protein
MTTIFVLVLRNVPQECHSSATSLLYGSRAIGGAAGVAPGASVFRSGMLTHLQFAFWNLCGGHQLVYSIASDHSAIDRIIPQDLRSKARMAVMDSIHDVFWLDFLASIVGLLFAMVLLMSTAFPEEDQDDDPPSAI